MVAFALFLLCLGCDANEENTPFARGGALDLSDRDILREPLVRLDGEWEFYWRQLVSPADFGGATPPVLKDLASLPSSWSKFTSPGAPIGSVGYATFRLRVTP